MTEKKKPCPNCGDLSDMVYSSDMKGFVCPRCGLFEVEKT